MDTPKAEMPKTLSEFKMMWVRFQLLNKEIVHWEINFLN